MIEIKSIPKDMATNFVQTYHYSQIMPRLTKYWLGLYENDKFLGVITLGWGTQPLQTIHKLFPEQNYVTKDYLEIGKMCFLPSMNNSNFGSRAIAALIHWCKENTEAQFLYTLADGIMGKCGYVYQASNFYYLGSFKTSVYMDRETGEKIHPRSAKTLCQENAIWESKKKVFWLTHNFCEYKGIDKINGLMFRYILPLNKRAAKVLKKTYPIKPYPKDKDLLFERRIENGKFEQIPKPEFNMNIFNYNYQKGKSTQSTS